jgi:hypothetical protein
VIPGLPCGTKESLDFLYPVFIRMVVFVLFFEKLEYVRILFSFVRHPRRFAMLQYQYPRVFAPFPIF